MEELKWYSVVYYTMSDCKNSVDVQAVSASEAEEIVKGRDDFYKLISCSHLPYKV